jgi:hypothetical protein
MGDAGGGPDGKGATSITKFLPNVLLNFRMANMSPVIRIKAELALSAASEKLRSQHAQLRAAPVTQADTVTVVRKELDKLVQILADDASEKHFNVAARVAKCADYLAQIPSAHVQEARGYMIAAHRALQDVLEIAL